MKTISEKAEAAIMTINAAIAVMRSQMKIQVINKPAADKLVTVARRKAKTAHNAYFNRRPKDEKAHLGQIKEVGVNRIIEDLEKAHKELNAVCEIYFAAIPFMKLNSRKRFKSE